MAGELVTASLMNIHVRDNLLALATMGQYRCFAYNSGSQTVTAGNTTALTLDSEVYDSGTMHSTSSNTNRILLPVAGVYRIWGASKVTNNNNGTATLHLRKSGAALTPIVNDSFTTSAGDFEDQWMHVHALLVLDPATDYIDLAGQAATQDFAFGTTQLIVEGVTAVV